MATNWADIIKKIIAYKNAQNQNSGTYQQQAATPQGGSSSGVNPFSSLVKSGVKEGIKQLGGEIAGPQGWSGVLNAISPELGNLAYGGTPLEVGAGYAPVGEGIGAIPAAVDTTTTVAPTVTGSIEGGIGAGAGGEAAKDAALSAGMMGPGAAFAMGVAPGLVGSLISKYNIFGMGQSDPSRQDEFTKLKDNIDRFTGVFGDSGYTPSMYGAEDDFNLAQQYVDFANNPTKQQWMLEDNNVSQADVDSLTSNINKSLAPAQKFVDENRSAYNAFWDAKSKWDPESGGPEPIFKVNNTWDDIIPAGWS